MKFLERFFILKFTADSASPLEWNANRFFLDQNIDIKKLILDNTKMMQAELFRASDECSS